MEDEFDSVRADKAFVDVAGLMVLLRQRKTEYTNTEIAGALLQVAASIDDDECWWQFLRESLEECIYQEQQANLGPMPKMS